MIRTFGNLNSQKEAGFQKGVRNCILFDATTESAISNLKKQFLLKPDTKISCNWWSCSQYFKSIFKILWFKSRFHYLQPRRRKICVPTKLKASRFTSHDREIDCKCVSFWMFFWKILLNTVLEPFVISNVNKSLWRIPNKTLGGHLLRQGIQSCVLSRYKRGSSVRCFRINSLDVRALKQC